MRLIPRRFLMTDEEKEFFYGRDSFQQTRYQKLRENIQLSTATQRLGYGIPLSESAYIEYNTYKRELNEISSRTPDYRAIMRNIGWETLATSIEALGAFLMIGGIHIDCDNIRARKALPYKN